MATNISQFELSDSILSAGESSTLNLVFTTPVIAFSASDLYSKGVVITDLRTTDDGQTWTATVTPIDGYNGDGLIRVLANNYFNGVDYTSGNRFDYNFDVDTTNPLTPTITMQDPGPDGVYNGEEVGVDGTVTATITLPTSNNEFETTKPGDTVTVNGVDYTITQGMIDNGLQIEVTPETNPSEISAVITDIAGNSGEVATQTVPPADTQGPTSSTTALTIDSITVDNIINLEESNAIVAVTGIVSGEFQTGDVVTLTINNTDYTGTTAADGSFSIDVAGSDLVEDSDTTLNANVEATDPAGNTGIIVSTKQYSVDTIALAPTVIINEDADDDGVITYFESEGDVDFTVTVADDAQVDDILTLNGTGITITQDIIDNGYQGTLPTVDGSQVDVTATVTDQAGNISVEANDSALIDLTIPDADPIFLWHLGANLTDSQGPSDHRGKFGGRYGDDISFETGIINDYIYIGYEGFDNQGNLIVSPWDGDFERDCGDGDVVWTMETYAGHDVVQIREDQNAYTVAKLGSGDDTYYVQGEMDSNLIRAKTNPEARSYIYTESGDDTVVIGGNANGKVTGWGIDGGRIFTGSGSDSVTVYGEMDDGGVIDLGAGRTEYADRNDIDAANTVDSTGDVNNLTISCNLGDSGSYDYGRVYGGLGDDNVAIGTYVEGTSEIDLGEGTNSISVGCDITGQSQIITGSGNDSLHVGDDIRYYSQVDLGHGNNTINVNSTIKGHSNVKTGNGDDSLTVGYSITHYADVNLGDGNNTVTIADDVDLYSGLRTGNGDDIVTIGDDIENYAVVDLGEGNNVIVVTDALEDRSKTISGSGNDTLKIGGSTWNVATAELGAGDDTVTIAGKMNHSSKINLGEGNNEISIGGMQHYSKITSGSGDDVIDLGETFCTYTYYNHIAVETGAGNDTVTFSGKKMNGKVTAGEGEDTLVLDFNTNDCLVSQWLHETNASTKNINGFEVIKLEGQNVIDIRFNDLLNDSDRDGALFIQGNELSKVDLGSTNWNSDSTNKAKFDDATGGRWTIIDKNEVDGITYDVYHHSFATENSNDVYIEQGIVII